MVKKTKENSCCCNFCKFLDMFTIIFVCLSLLYGIIAFMVWDSCWACLCWGYECFGRENPIISFLYFRIAIVISIFGGLLNLIKVEGE